MTNIEKAIFRVNATVGIAAKHLATGREILQNANDTFYTASTFKVPLIVALFRLVDQGKIDPSERIKFSDSMRVQSSRFLNSESNGHWPEPHDP